MTEKHADPLSAGQKRLERQENEQIIEIEMERLKDFHDHPFRIREDREMKELVESISRFGVLSPLVVRPLPEGKYEVISGHRRKYAAQLLGYRKVPVIIRVMNDDDAVISMVDANIHRESILPSEKAFAVKMKYDAMKRSNGRKKRSQIDPELKGVRTVQLLGKETGDSAKQIQRYLKITELIPELRDLLDNKQISFNPAYELAFLPEKEQRKVFQAIKEVHSPPSLSQAQRIRKQGTSIGLTVRGVKEILSEIKKGDIHRVVFKNEQLYQFFPKNYPPKKMKQDILNILKQWTEEKGKLAQNWQPHYSQKKAAGPPEPVAAAGENAGLQDRKREKDIKGTDTGRGKTLTLVRKTSITKREDKLKMCKVIVVANQKGGCSKTSVVANLGAGLAREGKRVCCIDSDPQGSLTISLGYPDPDELPLTLATIMMDIIEEKEFPPDYGVLHHQEGMDLIPANMELSGIEVSLANTMSREMILKEYIEMIRDRYDYTGKREVLIRDADALQLSKRYLL